MDHHDHTHGHSSGHPNQDATNVSSDGIDRRGFLKCMAWAGTGLIWTLSGGVTRSLALPPELGGPPTTNIYRGDFTFAQISDSHLGFNKAANPDVLGTLQAAIDRLNALPIPPAFLIHTGDLTHLAKPEEFDLLEQTLKSVHTGQIFYVPGEHDVINDEGVAFLQRYGQGSFGGGWRSFDYKGVHFVGLVNVLNLKAGGLGQLGPDQLTWLQKDLAPLGNSTPIVVFAHIPLWTVYPAWGWGTDDGAQALALLARFGSVTVLNGHIHQILHKVEGNVTFHTACSTAFPQPVAGMAPSPGPMKVPADQLRGLLGITSVNYVENPGSLAIVDTQLDSVLAAPAAAPMAMTMPVGGTIATTAVATGQGKVTIDNFSFSPQQLTVTPGTTVTWTNQDDIPHTVVNPGGLFHSKGLDTDDKFSFTFTKSGTYPYFCSVHPMMTGQIVVK